MTHDEEFAAFMRQIDNLFVKEFGIGYENFPDWDYYSAFDDGITPFEAFEDWKEEYYPE